jgi:hypothetical protein
MNESALERNAWWTRMWTGFEMDREQMRRLHRHYIDSECRLVMVMSHSCFVDVPMSIMMMRGLGLHAKAFIGMHPFWAPALRAAGQIARPSRRSKLTRTQSAILDLNRMKQFSMFISMGGENDRRRSGYYHIAKGTQAQIIVVGIDYARRSMYVSQRRWTTDDVDSHDAFCLLGREQEIVDELNCIYPLYERHQAAFDSVGYRQRNVDVAPTLDQDMIELRSTLRWRMVVWPSIVLLLITALCLFVLIRQLIK